MKNETDVTRSIQAKLGDPTSDVIAAAQRLGPRDLVATEKQIISTIANGTVEQAESCVYCKPIGKNEKGRQTFSIGPSVRLTEIGQQAFGWIWCNVVVEIDGHTIEAIAKVFDLRTGNIYHARASRNIGNVTNASVIENWCNGVSSIARRNALLQAMRPQLTHAETVAKQKVIRHWAGHSEAKLDNAAYTKAFNAIAADYNKRWGTKPDDLKKLVEDEGTPDDKLWLLCGIRNWLIDNETKYSDVFGNQPTIPQPTVRVTQPTHNTDNMAPTHEPATIATPTTETTTSPDETITNSVEQDYTTESLDEQKQKPEETSNPSQQKTTKPSKKTATLGTNTPGEPKANQAWIKMILDMAAKVNVSRAELDAIAAELTGAGSLDQVTDIADMNKINNWLVKSIQNL